MCQRILQSFSKVDPSRKILETHTVQNSLTSHTSYCQHTQLPFFFFLSFGQFFLLPWPLKLAFLSAYSPLSSEMTQWLCSQPVYPSIVISNMLSPRHEISEPPQAEGGGREIHASDACRVGVSLEVYQVWADHPCSPLENTGGAQVSACSLQVFCTQQCQPHQLTLLHPLLMGSFNPPHVPQPLSVHSVCLVQWHLWPLCALQFLWGYISSD